MHRTGPIVATASPGYRNPSPRLQTDLRLWVPHLRAPADLPLDGAIRFRTGWPPILNRFKTLEQAIDDYLAEKRATLDPYKESARLTNRKREDLAAFQETW